MKIKRFLLVCSLLLCSFFAGIMQAQAATASYLVTAFKISGPAEYNYLEQSVPQMLSSRLFWSGQAEPSSKQDNVVKKAVPAGKAEAEQILKQNAADYIFYGTITILGQEASIDITALDNKGTMWQKSAHSSVNSLISSVQGLADSLSKEVFGRNIPTSAASNSMTSTPANTGGSVPLSGDFLVNDTGTNQVYLNPEFRYQGQDSERLRSQSLPFATISMDIADLNDDGKEEVLFLDDVRTLYLYTWDMGTLKQLATYRLGAELRPLQVRAFRQQGKNYIALSAYREDNKSPLGIILEYNGQEMVEVLKNANYFLSTAILPDTTRPVLIGQAGDSTRLFRGPVMEMYLQNNSLVKGGALPNLPDKANVFNFVYMPDKEDASGYKVVMLNETEKVQVYSSKGSRMHQTDETYSGSNAYFKANDAFTPSDDAQFYYIPMRMIVQDLDMNGQYEVLANKPISTAAAFFKNFRNYPQGEIHSMVWDGIGLNLLWKTRRISGTIADFQLANPNGDNVTDLAVCVVTYPGSLGTGDRKTILTLFPLDTNLTDPNTPVANEMMK